jgi:hypothetical protein
MLSEKLRGMAGMAPATPRDPAAEQIRTQLRRKMETRGDE